MSANTLKRRRDEPPSSEILKYFVNGGDLPTTSSTPVPPSSTRSRGGSRGRARARGPTVRMTVPRPHTNAETRLLPSEASARSNVEEKVSNNTDVSKKVALKEETVEAQIGRVEQAKEEVDSQDQAAPVAPVTPEEANYLADQLLIYFLGAPHLTPEERERGWDIVRNMKRIIREGKIYALQQQQRMEGHIEPSSS